MENMNLLEQVQSEERKEFQITNDQQAEWALRRIVEAQEDAKRWGAFYDGQKAKSKASSDETIQYFEGLLESYFATVPHKKAKTQESYALPGGKLIHKEQGPQYIQDAEALLAYLKRNDRTEYIQITETPVWGELKKVVKIVGAQVADVETGEIIEGVQVIERPPIFKVQLSKGGSDDDD